MDNCNTYSLAEVVELYCLHQFNDRKRNFDTFLPMAKLVWEDLLMRTIWSTRFTWVDLKPGTPYNYLDIPKNTSMVIGVYITDDCNQLVPLSINNRISIIPKPNAKSCGCKEECQCGSLCAGMNAMGYEEEEVTIDGDTYTNQTWIQICASGEVKKWRKVWSTNEAGAVVAVEDFEALCTLSVKPCGCVEETEENKQLIATKCGCSLASCTSKISFPQAKHKGIPEYKYSDCGTKIMIIGSTTNRYGVLTQSWKAAENSKVPRYCLDAMFSGIEDRKTRWDPRKHFRDKEYAKDAFNIEKKNVLKFLNPIDLERLARISGEQRKW